MIGIELKKARNKAGLSRRMAGQKLVLHPKSIEAYEIEKLTPAPEVVLAMAKLYNEPSLNQHYCRQQCAIGAVYCFEYLNNVPLAPQNILLKLQQEYREVESSLERMLITAVNKKEAEDFSEKEKKDFQQDIHRLLNLEHAMEMLKLELQKRKWVDLPVLISEHNSKCYRKGYVVNGLVKDPPAEYGKMKAGCSGAGNRDAAKAQMICSLPPPGKQRVKKKHLA